MTDVNSFKVSCIKASGALCGDDKHGAEQGFAPELEKLVEVGFVYREICVVLRTPRDDDPDPEAADVDLPTSTSSSRFMKARVREDFRDDIVQRWIGR